MDITTLAAWGEFIGGVAVVVSLIYLAGQIRQNSKLLRASTTSASNQIQSAMTTLLAQEPDVARVFWDGIADRDSLSEEDRRRFDPLLTLWFQPARQQFQFQRDGIGNPEEWAYNEQGVAWVVQEPGVRQWWREWRRQYPQEFRNFVDDLIREGEAAG
jgi:hypothetical protein